MANKNINIKKALLIDRAALKAAKEMRDKSIQDAIALEGGPSQKEQVFHVFWKEGGLEVGVGKPGKEADRNGELKNANDMWPYIRQDGSFKVESATFKDVFRDLQHAANKSRKALEFLGCLFVRSAFILDHEEKDGKVIYVPPIEILEEIKKDIPMLYGVPLEAFLQYTEMIALNEDVKYHTRGKTRGKPFGPGAGRQNNLLTCAHLIAVLLGRADLVDFAYGFAMMRGVSPITMKKAKTCFPLLGEDVMDAAKIS